MLLLRLCVICIQVWFIVVAQLAVNMPFRTAFMIRFIWRIFPSESKMVPWNSPPVGALKNPEPDFDRNNTQNNDQSRNEPGKEVEKRSILLVARDTIEKQRIQTQAVVIATSYEPNMLEPRILSTNFRYTFTMLKSATTAQSCYLIGAPSIIRSRCKNSVKIVRSTKHWSIILSDDTDDKEAFRIGATKTSTTFECNAPYSTVNPIKSQQADISAVYRKNVKTRDSWT